MWVRETITARYSNKILSDCSQSDIRFWTWDRNHWALWQRAHASLMCHLIAFGYTQVRAEWRVKIDGGQSNYVHHYMSSRLISEAWGEEDVEAAGGTDESLPAAWDLLGSRRGFGSSACPPVGPYGGVQSQWYLNPAWPFTGAPVKGMSTYEM